MVKALEEVEVTDDDPDVSKQNGGGLTGVGLGVLGLAVLLFWDEIAVLFLLNGARKRK